VASDPVPPDMYGRIEEAMAQAADIPSAGARGGRSSRHHAQPGNAAVASRAGIVAPLGGVGAGCTHPATVSDPPSARRSRRWGAIHPSGPSAGSGDPYDDAVPGMPVVTEMPAAVDAESCGRSRQPCRRWSGPPCPEWTAHRG
jgi:hypothetical protein